MSHTKPDYERSKVGNIPNSHNKRKMKNSRKRGNHHQYHPYNNFQYYSPQYNYQPRRDYWRRRPPSRRFHNKTPEQTLRPPSPFSGTEEYTLKKIQETSDMIKRRLMMPETEDILNTPETLPVADRIENENDKSATSNGDEKVTGKNNKKASQYNVEEIHNKIITHITNLSYGKKMNLICANSSGYDIAIQQIHKQKRLELSKALRDMCSNQTAENSDAINSIIPDIGIKIEDLPLEVIKELSSTLDLNFNNDSFIQDGAINVKTEVYETDVIFPAPESPKVKKENSDDCCLVEIKQEVVDLSDDICDGIDDFLMEASDFNLKQGHNVNSVEIKQELHMNTHISANFDEQRPNMITVGLQTDSPDLNSASVQTDNLDSGRFQIDKEHINSLDDAITTMQQIDAEIMRLTELRQSIFADLQKKQAEASEKKTVNEKKPVAKKSKKAAAQKNEPTKKRQKNSKVKDSTKKNGDIDILIHENDGYYGKVLNFKPIAEKVLVLKVIEDTLLAASERGNIYYINTADGASTGFLSVSPAAITSLCYWMTPKKKLKHLLVGSSDARLREFNFETRESIRLVNMQDVIQCMELAWDCVFVGTVTGNLIRYSLKFSRTEFEERISQDSVMVLKATQEGARRVLLVGMRNEPVCVRDAMSGLFLRTMTDVVTPTVYGLVLENSMVYCGTKFHDILVFSFHDGSLVHKHEATNSKGISCMKVDGNLLFASCYNGSIYVYNIKSHQFVGTIQGPGGVILSIEILKNLVIVGTMSLNFKSILIPDFMLEHNKI